MSLKNPQEKISAWGLVWAIVLPLIFAGLIMATAWQSIELQSHLQHLQERAIRR